MGTFEEKCSLCPRILVFTTYEPWVVEHFHCKCGAFFCGQCETLLFQHGYVHNAWWLYQACPLCVWKLEQVKQIYHEPTLSLTHRTTECQNIVSILSIPTNETKIVLHSSEKNRDESRIYLLKEKQRYEEERKTKFFSVQISAKDQAKFSFCCIL